MADTPRPTDAELLAELGPLAAVIADKLRTVPVRLGPAGTDDLISELTIAVAVYIGRDVLPADALALANPPRPADTEWAIEYQRHSTGEWLDWGVSHPDRSGAQQLWDHMVDGSKWPLRLVRRVTSHITEAEYTPATEEEDTQRREPHPTQADVDHAVAVLDRFQSQSTTDQERQAEEVVHGCPPDGSGLTPCCGRTPFELPLGDRISSEAPTTCPGAPS
ncbi:hypothetical protein [Streptomyces griseorubiginosus]|uniref:hypothetical protein n=1 Tax=Streptomyces griseorubiginosus TaxID=67304 RepID=UPI0036E8BD8D